MSDPIGLRPLSSTLFRGQSSTGRLWAGGPARVLCFPAAGSSCLSFRPLANALAGRVTVLAVEPLERVDPSTALVSMADQLARDIRPWLTGDVVLLGHSFGGYLAYEVARRIRCAPAHSQMTLRLVLVGCAAPTHAVGLPQAGDDDALLQSLTSLGAVPEVLRREPALLRQYLPAIRADLATVAAYVHRFRTPGRLPVPTLAVRGSADPLVPVTAVAGWQQLCHPAAIRCLSGDHYLPQQAPGPLAAEILRWAEPVSVAG